MPDNHALREDVLLLLQGRKAHVGFERAVTNLPEDLRGKKPRGLPYSPWQQLEHMRIAQGDILEYIRDPQHVSPAWPEGYWPGEAAPARNAWAKSVRAFQADRQALLDMAADPATGLLAPIPADPNGPTILHELLLVADHNAYHLGQLIVLRRLLGAWRDSARIDLASRPRPRHHPWRPEVLRAEDLFELGRGAASPSEARRSHEGADRDAD